MWPFSAKLDATTKARDELQGRKRVAIDGQVFVIRRLNPLLDFNPSSMPQIFSSFQSRREPSKGPADEARALRDMMSIVEAGTVGIQAGTELLELSPKPQKGGQAQGITVEDVFRDQAVGAKLYWEILLHSLDRFRGIKKVFFYLTSRFTLFMLLRRSMDSLPIQSPSRTAA